MDYYIGIDIGGTKIVYGLFDEKLNLLDKQKQLSDDKLEGTEYFSVIVNGIIEFIRDEQLSLSDIKGIGIGMAGFVDFEQGKLIRSPSLPKLLNFPVADFLNEKLGGKLRIVLDNDCHSGALAEYRRGAGRNYSHMLYCPVSTGISTGIIINGKLFRGSNGASGESGHMLADVQGKLKIECGCGNSGCFNSLCSGKAITHHVRGWISEGEETVITELAGSIEEITAEHINIAYEQNDAMAEKAIEQMAQYMAMWLFNVYMVFNIDCFVFSGGLLAFGDKLFERVIELFKQYQHNGFEVHFYKTELGTDSGLIGAVELLF